MKNKNFCRQKEKRSNLSQQHSFQGDVMQILFLLEVKYIYRYFTAYTYMHTQIE